MAFKRVWKQMALFTCGAIVGFLFRDVAYWHGGLRTSTIHWLRGKASSQGQSLVDVMAARPPPLLPPPPCRCPAPAAAQPAPAWPPTPTPRTAPSLRTAPASPLAPGHPQAFPGGPSAPPPPPAPPPAPAPLRPAVQLPPAPKRLAETCAVAKEAAVNNQVLVFIGDANVFAVPTDHKSLIYQMMTSLINLQVNNILLVATEPPAYQKGLKWIEYCRQRGVRLHVIRRDIATPGALMTLHRREQQSAKKFPVIRDLLQCGVNVLLSDFDVLYWDNPFKYIVGDADVEGMTDGWDAPTQYGFEVSMPPQLGFARWQMRAVLLNSGFFYVRASQRTIETMHAVWDMLTKAPIWDQAAFNCQVRAPLGTGDGGRLHGRGLSIRVMNAYLFSNSLVFHVVMAPLTANSFFLPASEDTPRGFKWPGHLGRPVALHVNYHLHKLEMMAYARRAFAKATPPSLGPPAPQLAASTALPPVPPSLVEVCKIAQRASANRQVLVLVGDRSVFGLPNATSTPMYGTLTSLIKLKVNNVLLVATDPEAYRSGQQWVAYAGSKGVRLHVVARYVATPKAQRGRSTSEQQSAKKYPVLRDLLRCDVNVLLSDFNTLFWDNPFAHIFDDAELEALSDGWDYGSKFGFEVNLGDNGHWFPPWEWRVGFLSSGFFYVRASTRTVRAMDGVWSMLKRESIWDHVAFNLQVRMSLGTTKKARMQGLGLTIRVMDTAEFPNSYIFHEKVDPTTLSAEYLPPSGSVPTGFSWPTPWQRPVAMSVNLHRRKAEMMDYARRAFPQASRSM